MHAVGAFETVLILLALIVALHWLAQKLKLPPCTALLVGGGALAFAPGLPSVSLDPELALVLFLPPLLMDGAYSTALGRFRRQLPGILSLAVGAVVFTTLAVGVVAHWLVPTLPWAACFALGAIVSPPDAVSARAVLKDLTLPRRLSALLEGESLRKVIDDGPLSIARAIRIFDDIASALAYAHEEKVVHRGVRPSKVLVQLT